MISFTSRRRLLWCKTSFFTLVIFISRLGEKSGEKWMELAHRPTQAGLISGSMADWNLIEEYRMFELIN